MPALTPIGVIAGLLLGSRIVSLTSLTPALFITVTFIGGLGISTAEFAAVIKRPKALLVFLLGSLVIMPVVAWLFASVAFRSDPEVRIGFILLTAIPTAITGYLWSSIHKGNEPLSLTIILIGTLVAPLTTVWLIQLLGGVSVAIDSRSMMASLFSLVVIPTAAGSAINTISHGTVTKSIAPSLKPFSKIALVLIVVINTASVSEQLLASLSWSYLGIALSSLALAVSGYLIASVVARLFRFGREETVSLTFAIAMRNISASLVLAIQYFPPATALPIIFGIVFQQSTAAFMANVLWSPSRYQTLLAKEQPS
ncbi:MAG: bile acid:sodium symporter family protein [Sphaerochaeta sp.]